MIGEKDTVLDFILALTAQQAAIRSTRVFGFGCAQAETNTMSVGKQVMEFTTGRANITVAMREENQAGCTY